jgi:hypothetical protein
MAQPVQQLLAVIRFQDWLQGGIRFASKAAGIECQQVQVMVSKNGNGKRIQVFYKAEGFQ